MQIQLRKKASASELYNTYIYLLLIRFSNDDTCTADATSASGSDKADLTTVRGITTNGRGFSDVLMVATTVRMFNRLIMTIIGISFYVFPKTPIEGALLTFMATPRTLGQQFRLALYL